MIKVCNFSSGSDGNCTYVEVDGTHLLIDAGISASKIVANLARLNVLPTNIDGILITHDHNDHIKGLNVFAGKYNTPIFAHSSLYKSLNKTLNRVLSINKNVFYNQAFNIKSAYINSHELSHDATNTRGFVVGDSKNSFAILTDLGTFDENVVYFAKDSALVFIESNHDEQLLRENPKYPFHLKSRILSKKGHLSNAQCAKFVEQLSRFKTRQVVLSHLSKENNTPSLAYQSICAYLASKNIIEGKNIKIDVATTEIGKLFKIN